MTLGFIGLGIMGLPMALNLSKKSGLKVLGYDIVQEKVDRFDDGGGIGVDSLNMILDESHIIFLCLPSNELVEETIQNIIEKGNKGQIIVDLSSTNPKIIRKMNKLALNKGFHLIDSPVSGGEKGAIEASLVLMCGGEEKVYKKIEPLLLHMGKEATYLGDSGSGSIAKLANNMIVGCNIAIVAEAFAFAEKTNMDLEKLFQAIKGGFAGSEVLDAKAPLMIKRDFTPSARMAVHHKDLINAKDWADELGVEIPLSEIVLDYMNRIEEKGMEDLDHSALWKIYEENMGLY